MSTKRSHSLYRGRDWRVNSDWLGTCFYQRLVPRGLLEHRDETPVLVVIRVGFLEKSLHKKNEFT